MGLFGFLKGGKKKGEDASASEAEGVMRLDDADLSGIEPSETRYTQEYQDFLAAQEAAAEREITAEEKAFPAVSPEGFCVRFDRCGTSLIEEPETCEVCAFFCDSDATCRFPERSQ